MAFKHDEDTNYRIYNAPDILDQRGDVLTAFDAANDHFRALRLRASKLCDQLNSQDVASPEWRALWKELVDPEHVSSDPNVPRIKGNIHIDYGLKLLVHSTCFINRGCIIVDNPIYTVEVGAHTLIAPNVILSSISHPIDWQTRNGQLGPSLAGSVKVGKHCFLGANVVVLPGVEIGDGCVVGASSVVTRSMPAYHVVAGHPARAVRKIAIDGPDGPELRYEADGITVLTSQRLIEMSYQRSLGRLRVTLVVLAISCALLSLAVMHAGYSSRIDRAM